MTPDLHHLNRWLSEQPKDWPEALINLIDAMREFLRADKVIADELLEDGTITRAQYDEGMAEREPLREWLKQYEAHGIDPSLHGVLRRQP